MSLSLLEIASKGGILMLVLLILSIISFIIFFERYFKLLRHKRVDDKTLAEVSKMIREHKVDEAKKVVQLSKSYLSTVLTNGLQYLNQDTSQAQEAIEIEATKLVREFEKRTNSLATISSVAPLIGFLGTVTGMIKVFIKLQQAQAGVDIQLLAGGIWEAMLTTVGGLIVGIISLLFYNYIISRIEYTANQVESDCNHIILQIKGLNNETKA
ncbi:MAG TPA: MotA/TolQ/ExbB proton channel family protein [Candidatus Cloacimonadota bacterium]|jgi:biopolymer transport protein ExbB|nr:MotA/TolQ/ExbB proton channel family protein [Candidatus Cloacimonadales bacterium]HOE91138.1 MotA/TolQ/ExbB proton channel family protein [Candidatus Cloacimonadota bacterium]HOQ80573.1 MotA/TolQ/ExbB proton channel family protein [Candidatus Cloacimonadota bacterium]HPY96367.1 MotA/TolQ/ExbB proton channel family protein [Candidatus Cloacimonadota bacterium]HQB40700.1 MotA/TolQ/ExbB proton channel family protein [Candidatus Cloacimonadota bacterium]